MLRLLRLFSALIFRALRSRRDLVLENLALRQQLAVWKRRHPQPRISASDRLFWVMLRRGWSGRKQALILVEPETVVRWHRAGFKAYWSWISRPRIRAGRKCLSRELRDLIFRMVAENLTWVRAADSRRAENAQLRHKSQDTLDNGKTLLLCLAIRRLEC